MNDQKYDRINTLASKELDRRSVADSVARFLASGGRIQQIAQNAGAIQTQPTRIGTDTGGLNGKRWVDTVGPLSRPRASSEPKPKAPRLPGPASQSPPASALHPAAT